MKILGIIAEFNPFHNGHNYHFRESKRLTDADGVICVLSSSFLQRGEPGIIDKWERARMALAAGFDLVIELPMPYALRSAEFFAYGAISLLEATGVVNFISFGSESGDIDNLKHVAAILTKESPAFSSLLHEYLDQGFSYPKARTQALNDFIKQFSSLSTLSFNEIESLTANPNNILGLEYLKAINRLESQIFPITIPRKDADYHDQEIKGRIASATAIREALKKRWNLGNDLLDEEILMAIPETTAEILRSVFAQGKGPIFSENFALQILTLLRRADVSDIAKLYDVRAGLENRIKEAADKATSLNELLELVKTKRYTWTRIQRIIFHLLLNLTSMQCEYFDQLGGPQYIRVLGFSLRGQKILAKMKETARLPIITRIANHLHRSETPEPVNRMLELEIKATSLYSLAMPNPIHSQANRDLTEQVIIWK